MPNHRNPIHLGLLALGLAALASPALAAGACPVSHDDLTAALKASVKPGGGPSNGGLDNNEWAAVVDRNGQVCAVTYDIGPNGKSASGYGHPACGGQETEIATQIHSGTGTGGK